MSWCIFFFLIAHRFVSLWFFKNPFIVTSDTPRTLKSSRCILLYCSSQPSVPVSFINNPVEKKCPPAQKGWLALPSLFREIQNEWFHIFTILISLSVVPSLNTVTQPGKEKKQQNKKTQELFLWFPARLSVTSDLHVLMQSVLQTWNKSWLEAQPGAVCPIWLNFFFLKKGFLKLYLKMEIDWRFICKEKKKLSMLKNKVCTVYW